MDLVVPDPAGVAGVVSIGLSASSDSPVCAVGVHGGDSEKSLAVSTTGIAWSWWAKQAQMKYCSAAYSSGHGQGISLLTQVSSGAAYTSSAP